MTILSILLSILLFWYNVKCVVILVLIMFTILLKDQYEEMFDDPGFRARMIDAMRAYGQKDTGEDEGSGADENSDTN